MQWFALQTKPHKEFIVYEFLLREEIETFFPFVKVRPKNPRAAKRRPYFPGYMFVKVDLEEMGLNALKWTQGTKGLVAFGNVPAVVPDALIHQLQQQIESINEAGGVLENMFKAGETVLITGGPFAGYEAMFDAYLPGKDRVQVLLTFLSSHPQPVKLDIETIEKKTVRPG